MTDSESSADTLMEILFENSIRYYEEINENVDQTNKELPYLT